MVAGDDNLVFVRELKMSTLVWALSYVVSGLLPFPSQLLNSRTSLGWPARVKSPAWTNTSPSGIGVLMWEVREWVSDIQTNRS